MGLKANVKKMSAYIVIVLFGLSVNYVYADSSKGLIDKKSAVQIAEQEFIKKYGQIVLKQRPLIAHLTGRVWYVRGTLHCPRKMICSGGVAHAEIDADTGSVIKIFHDK